LRLRADGASYAQIARTVGVNRSTVRSVLPYAPRPPRPPAQTCRHGHDLTDPANVCVRPSDGARLCRACQRAAGRAGMRRLRARAAASGGGGSTP
jgi:hypothetical protein